MGVGGALEYFSNLLSSGHKHKKKKQLQTVELKVRMDCDGCELKVKNALSSMSGVKFVEISRKQQKVTITGYVEPNKVLKKARSTRKKAEIWLYVPYSLVVHPYTAQAYDKKTTPGYVRNVEMTATSTVGRQEDPYMNMFSDENPNACSIMYITYKKISESLNGHERRHLNEKISESNPLDCLKENCNLKFHVSRCMWELNY